MARAADKEVHALHRHLIWSIHMRDQCLQLNNIGKVPDNPVEKRLWLIRPFMWLALWLALLYVVAEGYQELGFTDPAIDKMLASPHILIYCGVFEMGHFTTRGTISILGSPMSSRQLQ